MTEQNKELVRRFFEAFAADDQETLKELLAPDHIFHHTAGPVDRETHLQGITAFTTTFSDLEFTIEEQIAEGDLVVTRLTWRAIHSGNFQGQPPTNNEVEVAGISIERIGEGRIAERWYIHDELGLMQQLGILPPMG